MRRADSITSVEIQIETSQPTTSRPHGGIKRRWKTGERKTEAESSSMSPESRPSNRKGKEKKSEKRKPHAIHQTRIGSAQSHKRQRGLDRPRQLETTPQSPLARSLVLPQPGEQTVPSPIPKNRGVWDFTIPCMCDVSPVLSGWAAKERRGGKRETWTLGMIVWKWGRRLGLPPHDLGY